MQFSCNSIISYDLLFFFFCFVCFQMDSEGEEQTLKTYHSSAGEWAFLVKDGWARARTRTRGSASFPLTAASEGYRFNSPTLELSILCIILSVKSAVLPFHYSVGNNFIKLEQRLKLAKEWVHVRCDWKALPWKWHRASVRRLPADAVTAAGGELIKSAFYWSRLAGEGAELVNRVHKGEIDLPFWDQVVGVVRGWAIPPASRASELAFSDR